MLEVTDTAAAVARVREEEGAKPLAERLFEDPFARFFRGSGPVDEVSEAFESVPFFREAVRVRTRFIDDGVTEALAGGAAQVLILGAGFDCRALRLHAITECATPVFEVDFASQLETKRRILERAGVSVPSYLRFIPCDLADPHFAAPLSRGLADAGFRADRPTCMIWEGVINYLEEPALDRSLAFLGSLGRPGSCLLFNYNAGRFGSEAFAARLREAGFDSVEDHGADELYRRYLSAESPPYGELFRIGRARVG